LLLPYYRASHDQGLIRSLSDAVGKIGSVVSLTVSEVSFTLFLQYVLGDV
jgi:hypothetical protein